MNKRIILLSVALIAVCLFFFIDKAAEKQSSSESSVTSSKPDKLLNALYEKDLESYNSLLNSDEIAFENACREMVEQIKIFNDKFSFLSYYGNSLDTFASISDSLKENDKDKLEKKGIEDILQRLNQIPLPPQSVKNYSSYTSFLCSRLSSLVNKLTAAAILSGKYETNIIFLENFISFVNSLLILRGYPESYLPISIIRSLDHILESILALYQAFPEEKELISRLTALLDKTVPEFSSIFRKVQEASARQSQLLDRYLEENKSKTFSEKFSFFPGADPVSQVKKFNDKVVFMFQSENVFFNSLSETAQLPKSFVKDNFTVYSDYRSYRALQIKKEKIREIFSGRKAQKHELLVNNTDLEHASKLFFIKKDYESCLRLLSQLQPQLEILDSALYAREYCTLHYLFCKALLAENSAFNAAAHLEKILFFLENGKHKGIFSFDKMLCSDLLKAGQLDIVIRYINTGLKLKDDRVKKIWLDDIKSGKNPF